ncbi:MAG: DUF1592 domain-containing protein [Planctomycetota bacterium]|nr:DUF1592 domain-containing protein [Planctomycetota bacterium]
MIVIAFLILHLGLQDSAPHSLREFVQAWCIDCHEEPRAKADLDLAVLMDRVDAGEMPDSLSRMLDRLVRRDMPPPGFDRPPDSEYRAVVEGLEQALRDHAALQPDRPRGTIARRLNRHEFGNTVRDLLELDFDAEDWLPVDEISNGFDNSGDVLSVSPLLLEKYFTIAELLARRSFPLPGRATPERLVRRGGDLSGSGKVARRGDGWWMSSRATVRGEFVLDAPGPYTLRVVVSPQQAGPDPVRMAISLDGARLGVVEVTGSSGEPFVIELEHRLDEGAHVLAASFVNDYYRPEDPDPSQRDRNVMVESLEIEGPHESSFPSRAQRRLIDRFGPLRGPATLRSIVQELADRSFRRPVEPGFVDQLLDLGPPGDPPWLRVRDAVTALLVHPRFLFRIEPQDADDPGGRPLDDWEIATRLSYFLWSTMPDDSLRRAAASGELTTPSGLAREVDRMLADERIRALGDHFASQWLQIRTLPELRPAESLFPGVGPSLLSAMHEETRRFFSEMIAEDLPITSLLDADWTWLNPELAQHYGIPGIDSGGFRKVALEGDEQSTGILRHASILLATSNPTRTSPVKRGKWVLEALLDDAPPPPPPGIPNLPEESHLAEGASLRKVLEQHRADPNCAACHLRMDALGFSLEGFDAVGRSRTVEANGMPIDDRGELPDGTVVAGAPGLRDQLLQGDSLRRFRRTLLKNLLVYALGREVDHRDDPQLVELASRLGNRATLRRMVVEITRSRSFLHRSGT